MFFVALMFASIYIVFVPIIAGKKHFFIGLALVIILGVLATLTGEMK